MVIRQQLSCLNFAELLRYLHSPGLFMIMPSEILEIHMYCACLANLHYINIFFTHVWCHVFYIICCHIFWKHCCDHTGKSTAMYSAVTSSGLFDEHFCQSRATGTACSVSSLVAKQFCSHFQELLPDLVIHCKKVS